MLYLLNSGLNDGILKYQRIRFLFLLFKYFLGNRQVTNLERNNNTFPIQNLEVTKNENKKLISSLCKSEQHPQTIYKYSTCFHCDCFLLCQTWRETIKSWVRESNTSSTSSDLVTYRESYYDPIQDSSYSGNADIFGASYHTCFWWSYS